MYLTGGQYKGHKIEVPNDTKPTLSKVRESVFNILNQYETYDNKFLDMFAGSAIMGLEAFSRGYDVYEIEINPKTAQIIKKNYTNIKAIPKLTVCNALKYNKEKFNIIYLDPPWADDYEKIIIHAKNLLEKNGIIIVEYDNQKNIDLKQIIEKNNLNLEIIKSKKYGRCLIDFLR